MVLNNISNTQSHLNVGGGGHLYLKNREEDINQIENRKIIEKIINAARRCFFKKVNAIYTTDRLGAFE